jgi:hypothetical protein
MGWDMKIHENGMKPHGWVMGERIINQTTSKTTDDIVQDRMLRAFEKGTILHKGAEKGFVIKTHITGMTNNLLVTIEEAESSKTGVLEVNR